MEKVAVRLVLIAAGVLLGLVFLVWLVFEPSLYVPARSDEDLVSMLFDPQRPGYGEVQVLSAEGEGWRRIPRVLQVEVELESYPRTVTCAGEILWREGDPMFLGITWQTLECAGHNRYIELAQEALRSGGLEGAECHTGRIAHLLARWLDLGLIDLDDLPWPETRARLTELAADPDLLTRLAPYDGGLFDTGQLVLREDVVPDRPPYNETSFVVRCDGTFEAFPVSPGQVRGYVDLQRGDDLLPMTLEPFQIGLGE